MTTPAAVRSIPAGLYFQIYLDALRASDKRSRLEAFAKSNTAKLPIVAGLIGHDFPKRRLLGGFSSDCSSRAREIISTIRSASSGPMIAGLAYGLDGRDDSDSTRLTAREKGERMGAAVAASGAQVLLPNAETQWDSTTGPEDDMNEAGALEMGRALRAITDVVAIDQPWPMPEQHGDNRKTPKPIGEGGSFAGFPIEEFATWVDVRAPQFYWANWYRFKLGKAYGDIGAWMEKEWKSVEDGIRKLDPKLVKPRTTTVQGYAHDSYPWTLANHLIRTVTTKPVIMWCEPTPTASTVEILGVVARVVAEAKDANIHPVEMIKRKQAMANLVPDGIVGAKTWEIIR